LKKTEVEMPTATCEGCGREVEYDAETLARRSNCMYCGKPLRIADEMVEEVKKASIPPPPAVTSEPPAAEAQVNIPLESPAERHRRMMERKRIDVKTVPRDEPEPRPILKFVLIGGGLVLVALGIYLFCYYQAVSKQQDFMAATMGLQEHLFGLRTKHGKKFDTELVHDWVLERAAESGVEVVPGTIVLTAEVITDHKQLKKTTGYRSSRDAFPGTSKRDPTEWLIGFEGRFHTEYGLYDRTFDHQQFTSFPYGN
jgi:hypothetical protein